MSIVKLDKVSKSFVKEFGNKKSVLSDFSLEINDSKFYTVVGPNGCGKSTILNIIAKTLKPDSGSVIYSQNKEAIKIGYVCQDYRTSLLPWLNVGENITLPLKIKGINKQGRRQAAKEILSRINIDIDIRQKTYQLSGGQQQVVNIFRNMVLTPDILLLDEPFSALDQFNRWSLAFLFEKLWLGMDIPVIFISHDVDEAILLGDEILLLNKNACIEKRLINNAPHPRTIEMLSTEKHNEYRKEVIKFLFDQGAINSGEQTT